MVTPVPFCDVAAAYAELRSEIDAAVASSLLSGRYIGGKEVETFEEAFSEYVRAEHCVGVANGLDALRLALLAMGIGPGDEVIVPSNTYIATWLAVSHCGATPIPVEPREDTLNIDPDRIAEAITERTRAIIPVHFYGQPADLDPILTIAQERGLRVLEDGAQAHGARYKGRRIGSHGDAVAWSFYPTKNLGAFGDAGAVTTNDASIAHRVRMLGNYGSTARGQSELQGYNSRLDPLQAAALSVKLKYLDDWNQRRADIAARYDADLTGTSLVLPLVPEWAEPVWHLYVVRHPDRDLLGRGLRDSGVETLVHYPIPPHLQAAYAGRGFRQGQLPIAEQAAKQALSLPMWPQMHPQQLARTTSALRTLLAVR